jgi:hypothetical protein
MRCLAFAVVRRDSDKPHRRDRVFQRRCESVLPIGRSIAMTKLFALIPEGVFSALNLDFSQAGDTGSRDSRSA